MLFFTYKTYLKANKIWFEEKVFLRSCNFQIRGLAIGEKFCDVKTLLRIKIFSALISSHDIFVGLERSR